MNAQRKLLARRMSLMGVPEEQASIFAAGDAMICADGNKFRATPYALSRANLLAAEGFAAIYHNFRRPHTVHPRALA